MTKAAHFFLSFLSPVVTSLFVSVSGFAEESPNIVVIMADDLVWRGLHCYGNEKVDTPHLDQFEVGPLQTQGIVLASPKDGRPSKLFHPSFSLNRKG